MYHKTQSFIGELYDAYHNSYHTIAYWSEANRLMTNHFSYNDHLTQTELSISMK